MQFLLFHERCIPIDSMSTEKVTGQIINPNPQGKGANPILGFLVRDDADIHLPDIQEDSVDRIINDYLSSLFVLSCDFKFKPVPGNHYFIYSHKGSLLISLIEPDRGGEHIFDAFVGECFFRKDLTWAVSGLQENSFSVAFSQTGECGVKTIDKTATAQLRSILNNIQEIQEWRFNTHLGFYQNAMSYLVLKSLYYRCIRLKDNAVALSEAERLLIEEF